MASVPLETICVVRLASVACRFQLSPSDPKSPFVSMFEGPEDLLLRCALFDFMSRTPLVVFVFSDSADRCAIGSLGRCLHAVVPPPPPPVHAMTLYVYPRICYPHSSRVFPPVIVSLISPSGRTSSALSVVFFSMRM